MIRDAFRRFGPRPCGREDCLFRAGSSALSRPSAPFCVLQIARRRPTDAAHRTELPGSRLASRRRACRKDAPHRQLQPTTITRTCTNRPSPEVPSQLAACARGVTPTEARGLREQLGSCVFDDTHELQAPFHTLPDLEPPSRSRGVARRAERAAPILAGLRSRPSVLAPGTRRCLPRARRECRPLTLLSPRACTRRVAPASRCLSSKRKRSAGAEAPSFDECP